MHVQVELNLQLKVGQGSLRRFLRGPLCEPLQRGPKVLDLLVEQGFGLVNRQDDAHRYEELHHLQRSGSGSLGNPLR